MTPTPEMLALARQCVAGVWKQNSDRLTLIPLLLAGDCDHYREVQSAIAAIQRTTELAAEYRAKEAKEYRTRGYLTGDVALGASSFALRNFDFLKGAV